MPNHPDIWDPRLQDLIDLGLGSELARSMRSRAVTLAKVQQMSEAKLASEGLPEPARLAVKHRRPPIPPAIVHDLLYRNRSTCCVCRTPGQSVVIHHIDPWEHSHSHEESNLAVLCLGDHGEAHTVRELGRNLTPDRIRSHKQEWEKEVRVAANRALFATKSVSLTGATWDYFNRIRIDQVLTELQIGPGSLPGLRLNAVDESALRQLRFRSDGRLRSQNADEYEFYAGALRAICNTREWRDLKQIWNAKEMSQLVQLGTLMVLTANHRFRSPKKEMRGPGQMRTGYHRASGIALEFPFDAWECTSQSAYAPNLMGQWICTSLCLARSIAHEGEELNIAATCLAIGTGFTEYSGSKPQIAYVKEAERDAGEGPDIDF
jgi:hypothetical protein